MTSSNFTIREACDADVATLLQLIRELADYEKLLDSVVATEDGLRSSLFGARPYAEALLAEADSGPIGFALFFHSFSTFVGKPGLYLEDVYVRPTFRGQGVGKAFFRRLARLAIDRGCGRMEWSVLNWNEPAWAFYRSIGATPLAEWTMQRLTAEALARLAEG